MKDGDDRSDDGYDTRDRREYLPLSRAERRDGGLGIRFNVVLDGAHSSLHVIESPYDEVVRFRDDAPVEVTP